MTELEVLRAAERSLQGRSMYEYSDWTSCTCGHVYKAAHGRKARSNGPVIEPEEGPYLNALRAIVRANKLSRRENSRSSADAVAVSVGTARVAERLGLHRARSDRAREAALQLVQTAIAHIEAEQEAARLDVLGQAQRIVDAAEPERELALQ